MRERIHRTMKKGVPQYGNIGANVLKTLQTNSLLNPTIDLSIAPYRKSAIASVAMISLHQALQSKEVLFLTYICHGTDMLCLFSSITIKHPFS